MEMKIAVIGTYPPQKDGIGIYNSRIVASLLKKGHDVRVFSFKGNEQKNVQAVLSKNNPFSYVNLFLKLNKWNPERILIQYEYLHFNVLFFPLLLFLLKVHGKKLNVIMHTVAPYTSGWKKFAFDLVHLSFFIFTDKLFLHTQNAKRKLLFMCKYPRIKPKICVVPISVQERNANPKKLNKRKVKLLMFGFITPDKGVDIAISAVNGLRNVSLKIVGSINPYSPKEFRAYLNKIKFMANAAKNVQFMEKYATESEKDRIFSEADFILLPYRFIEQSAILTEIWSFRKIPVASDIPAFREEIGNSYGILFAGEEPAALRSRIDSLVRRPAFRKKLLSNISRLAKERSFDATAERIIQLMS